MMSYFQSYRKYNILTEMKTCSRTLCFEVQCPCSKQQQTHTEISRNQNTSQIYSKVSQTLEIELKRQHEMHTREVDELNNQILILKNTVLRLEMRNHKDLQAEKELRREYNLLLAKLKQSEPKVINKVEVIEKIKEIPVEIENNQFWEKQLAYWKNKNNQMMIQLQKTRTEKELLEQTNQNLAEELNHAKQYADSLKTKIQNLTKTIEEKDDLVKKMHAQIDYLKTNKEVVIQTKHLFPEFRQPQKVRTQTKIETVYAEKPVQKLVFVDVVKKVKQFVQPQKAVVNRIIACEERTQCDCDQNQNRLQYYKNQANYLSGLVEKLESNVTSYKAERQNLVKVINDQHSELHRLQTTFRLIGATSQPPQKYSNLGSTVNVTVNKIREQRATPRNSSITHQKRDTFKK